MKDIIITAFGFIVGFCFLFGGIFILFRNWKQGKKFLNGEIIDINHEEQALIIRYKIDKISYQDISYSKRAFFLSGKIPPVGLKVMVLVHKDNPYQASSVIMSSGNSDKISRTGFTHTTRLRMTLSILIISLASLFFAFVTLFNII